ncbi:MAG: hypothetical protein IKN50_00620, partial [Clostridia bacterium]|nr:hypothetical protein [Clostridia bacterium]
MTGKAASVLSGLILSLLLISCAPRNGAFDRSDVQSEFSAEDAGIVRDGFVNVTKTWVNSADDAFRLAEK